MALASALVACNVPSSDELPEDEEVLLDDELIEVDGSRLGPDTGIEEGDVFEDDDSLIEDEQGVFD